jgi:hypothetical protein
MARLSWLADALRSEGLDVLELPGWQGRGKELTTVRGVVLHNTVTSRATADGNVDKLLRDGRPDLVGPLCQLGLRRSGTFVAVADGKGNHNGYGLWGNESVGIEVYNDGYDEPWTDAQVYACEVGTAVICRRLGRDPFTQVKGHLETDPKRKVDPRAQQVDLDALRRRMAVRLGSTPNQEDDMPTAAEVANEVIRQLDEHGTAPGTNGFRQTVIASLQVGQQNANALAALLSRPGSDVTAADIAAAIPDGLAQDVVDELKRRL